MDRPWQDRHPVVGWGLIVCGVIGLITGLVPFVLNALRILLDPDQLHRAGLAGHGVEAMGLSVEWGMLSSAMGTCLGALLLWAGIGWRRGRHWARPVTWAYVLVGLGVNITDMLIFIFHATASAMRTHMLYLDGLATCLPVVLMIWLLRSRES